MDGSGNEAKVIVEGMTWLAILGALAWLFLRLRRRRTWKWPDKPFPAPLRPNDITDPVKQLEFVSRVSFETQPLLNKAEYQVLLILEKAVRECRQGHRVMAQTSLGEILRPIANPRDPAAADYAYRSINSKRSDFVIVDRFGMAVVAIEYQGSGHYQGTAKLRDAVKREAFARAGVRVIEIPARYSDADVSRDVTGILRGGQPAAAK